jgi:hypothetical protein
MAQYKKTPAQLIKQFMEQKQYLIGADLIEFLNDVDIYFEREIKNAYNAGDGNDGRGEANQYYNLLFKDNQ